MNMYIKKIALSTLLLGALSITAQGQYLQDVLRFSQPEQGATARFKGLGNAQTALGGDLSSISGNPAGLGFSDSLILAFRSIMPMTSTKPAISAPTANTV